jgi:hypothetical protein
MVNLSDIDSISWIFSDKVDFKLILATLYFETKGVIFIYKVHETTRNESSEQTRTFLMLRFPLVRSQVGLGKDPNDCVRGSNHARKTHIRIRQVEVSSS